MPRKLVLLISLLTIVILCIPTYYAITYFSNKVSPLTEEITALEENGYQVERVKYDKFDKLGFELICKNYDLEKSYRATYTANIKTELVSVRNIKMQVALCANWIKFNEKSSTISLNKNGYNSTVSVPNLDKILTKTNPLIPFPRPTAYVLLTYETGTSKTDKHAYLIEYPYGSYKIELGGYKD